MSNSVHVADTVPYPWPYDGTLAVHRLALLICGAQQQLVALAHDAPDVGVRLAIVAAAVRDGGGTVMWIRHGRTGTRPRASLLPATGSAGWQLVVEPDAADLVVDCAGWDGCFGSALDHQLRTRGRRAVVLGGFASEVTVDSTVRTLNDQGHECLVLSDGSAPLDAHLGSRAQHSLTMSGGIFGALGTTAALLDALETSAGNAVRTGVTTSDPTPTRKEISA